MQLKYTDQPHQLQAIHSIIDLFNGQNRQFSEFDIFDGEAVCANHLTLDQETLLENLQVIQNNNAIEPSLMLQSLDFSIEMETGTGKTYVYVQTVLELHVKYGWSKFIVIVPSIAIKEGVLQTLRSTKEHFNNRFNLIYDFFEYDSSRLSSLKHFVRDDTLQIMIMTIDSFKRANTVLNQLQEGFVTTPKESLQQTHPILILDEPQNMESALSKTSINELNPLFTLRFSATHKNYYNLLYSLTPKQALEQGLVKQIDVLALSENQTINDAYVNVQKIEIDKKSRRPVATLEVIALKKEEFVKKTLTLKGEESLHVNSKNPIYRGFTVNEINAKEGYIAFENSIGISLNKTKGKVKKILQKEQITEAITRHIEKFETLKRESIKVLSLFFIDKVGNFLEEEEGWIEPYFCSEFNRLKVTFPSFQNLDAKEVYAFYFAKRKNHYLDELKNNESDRKLLKETYDLIMKKKEELLKFDVKTSFIFSHSALKEGWDNPNVFFITTLNDTKSQMKKRQILGRGLRLAVNAHGKRIHDKAINRLTVIANESFDEFARELQIEYGVNGIENGGKINNIKKNNKRAKLKLDWLQQNPEFMRLWEELKAKTIFQLHLDTENYKKRVIEKLNAIEVREKKILKQFGSLQSDLTSYVEGEKNIPLEYDEILPNLIKHIEKEIGISRTTILDIFEHVSLDAFIKNSDSYLKQALEAFDDSKHELLSQSDGIVYQKNGEFYEFSNVFPEEKDGFDLQDCHKGLYEAEQYDSEVEKNFIACADRHFKFFTKLPNRFKIRTPLGTYNPDFAVIKYDENEGSFIVETKGSDKERDLRKREHWQIEYAKKHFQLLNIAYRKTSHCKDI